MTTDEKIELGETAVEDAETPIDEFVDDKNVVAKCLPEDIVKKYEFHSYRNAALILSQTHQECLEDLVEALRAFTITTTMIRSPGGNESEMPTLVSRVLRPRGWNETTIQGNLEVTLAWSEPIEKNGKIRSERKTKSIVRERFIDGHKIDYVKGRVAFDMEWNSKDQTFDRDLYAFAAFSQCGAIDVGVILTRGVSLNPLIASLGWALNKNGDEVVDSPTKAKFGASTTWMGKLLYRLNAGRNGSCPVLAIGITPECVSDWNGAI